MIDGCKGIGLESLDGAILEDIVIIGNAMRDIVDAPLFLRLNRRNRGPKETMRAGAVRRILISNLVSSNSSASSASAFMGIADNLIEDIKVSDCFFGHRACQNGCG